MTEGLYKIFNDQEIKKTNYINMSIQYFKQIPFVSSATSAFHYRTCDSAKKYWNLGDKEEPLWKYPMLSTSTILGFLLSLLSTPTFLVCSKVKSNKTVL